MNIFLSRLLSLLARALGTFLAIYFWPFLGSEGSAIMTTPELILLWLFLLVIFIFVSRIWLAKRKRKPSWILLFLIYSFFFLFSFLLRFFIIEGIFSFLSVATSSCLILSVSSGSNESGNSGGESGATSLPALESSSSSESINTFRNVIAADYENDIFNRIRNLENGNS